ncbi:AAA family ATPase [Elizabethkingia anophelis]|uniref:AAA family ATPase n=1 Tax=Elizabethkingia sp. M8 TaxID=2796140 RepID=UPI0019044FBF|nr:AAA family ATPase [Elizabethkingia sp. M8]MDV3627815.1 AAA family ATPase [Elizabethkingia anophelis]MDV3688113.1 AAA family ATPase [Elizabethkingia anophelis]MDV3785216.1 AAA family ATPase [Elizabethkingia anophelis]MDV3809422.1 AAA family ATPase [Elizabethkingia anophelis]MDV3817274.1 AAA family ATPase [Elizabethkingia anophelis]
MQLRPSERRKAKIKMALQGSAGAGKTFSALLLAQGLTNGNFSKVAIIDTENGSADLYAHLGNYNVLSLAPPFTPEKYVEAIDVCIEAGMEVIIIDSISQSWEELLDYHSKLAGNSFTNWAKVTPRQNAFIDKILQCNAHIIATMRTKQDYVLNQKDGRFIPEKVGLKAVQRNDLDYEFTIVFDVDIKHFAVSSKDRTGLFMDKPEFKISAETGKMILNWCNNGSEDKPVVTTIVKSMENVKMEISYTNSIQELMKLYQDNPQFQSSLKNEFEARKSFLLKLNNPQNFSTNGNTQHN